MHHHGEFPHRNSYVYLATNHTSSAAHIFFISILRQESTSRVTWSHAHQKQQHAAAATQHHKLARTSPKATVRTNRKAREERDTTQYPGPPLFIFVSFVRPAVPLSSLACPRGPIICTPPYLENSCSEHCPSILVLGLCAHPPKSK